MSVRLLDVAVFLASGAAPAIVIWTAGAIRGAGINIGPTAWPWFAAFGFGMAVIARAKGWA